MAMNLTACFPGKYIQGRSAINQLENLIEKFGSKALIITSPSAAKHLPSSFSQSQRKPQVHTEIFSGECSETELTRMASIIKKTETEVIVAMGGGKAIDTGKIAADRAGLPVIVVPTIASTDAPCSGCAVTYTPDGIFEKVHYQKLNPSVVLVDVNIITSAPVRFLVAGMGDALATWFEARSCSATSSTNECGGLSTLAGKAIARLCYNVLLEHGAQAKIDCEKGRISQSLENIIEANILLSGIGFESGGLASAHTIHNGLTAIPETHKYYHGEKVAFGVLAGLHLTGAPKEEIDQVYTFCQSIGLPTSLSHLGISPDNHDAIMKVAIKSSEKGNPIHHEPMKITPQKIYNALLATELPGSFSQRTAY
jgi:glycerol dehydrogenase